MLNLSAVDHAKDVATKEYADTKAPSTQGVEYIVGTQTASTGSWTGVTTDAAIYTGKTIAYKLPYAGSGNASLNLTLSGGGTTGAKAVYINNTRVTTHYAANSVIKMTYDGSYWRADAYWDGNTKNTAGSTESASKLFLIGATSQAASPQTYSSSKVYETDGALVATSFNGHTIESDVPANALFTDTDTKNTAGSTADASKLFIVGAKSQAANPQTYSQANAYITAGKVYSNAKEVVNLSDTQALTNKTYNGYTLAAACAKGVDTTVTSGTTSTNLPTTKAVADYVDAHGGGGGTVDMPTGTVTMFAGSTAPTGWLICDGSAVSRTTYAALFAVIGTTYGTGNGSSTFNLPNLQGKFALGKSSSYALGSTGGAATVSLSTANLPAHTHGSKTLTGETSAYGDTGLIGASATPVSGGIIQKGGQTYSYGPDWANTTAYSFKVDATHEHDSVGSGTAHNNMPPYVSVNYIIKS